MKMRECRRRDYHSVLELLIQCRTSLWSQAQIQRTQPVLMRVLYSNSRSHLHSSMAVAMHSRMEATIVTMIMMVTTTMRHGDYLPSRSLLQLL